MLRTAEPKVAAGMYQRNEGEERRLAVLAAFRPKNQTQRASNLKYSI
jgi:hypothetical protein